MFTFHNPGPLTDGRLRLILVDRVGPDPVRDRVPAYAFTMTCEDTGESVGRIVLRIGDTDYIRLYAGHVGYRVEEPFRGNRFAARSCRLLFPLARGHGINPLWITCNPENTPSRRTCEIVGGDLAETVELPEDCDMYRIGERYKCRYRVDF